MITDKSLKMLDEAIKERVSQSNTSMSTWFNKDKGYPTVGINKEKASLPSALYLLMQTNHAKYQYPVYLTKKDIDNIKTDSTKPVEVLAGEKEHIVPSGHFCIVSEDGKMRKVSDKFETEWTPERIKDVKMVFVPDTPLRLYNIDQTNIKDVRPDLFAEMKAPYDIRDLDFIMSEKSQNLQAIDKLVEDQGWVCDINQSLPMNEPAYYSISNNEICICPRDLYNSAELYYGDLFHTMIHSKRMSPDFHIESKEAYTLEELTAELGAALLAQKANINKYPTNKFAKGSVDFNKEENISDLLANIYHTTTFINAVTRIEKNALDKSYETRPTNEQLRQLGKFLIKFGGDTDERYINNDRIEEFDTLKELKFKDIYKKFNRLESIHEQYYTKEYLWGYDTSDPEQLLTARLEFYGNLERARYKLNDALSSLAQVYGNIAIMEYNKYDHRKVLDTYTLPYAAIKYINSGEAADFLSARDKETIDKFLATDDMKNVEVKIIPNSNNGYKKLPLEKNLSPDAHLFDVELFRVPEKLDVTKDGKIILPVQEQDDMEKLFEQAENEAEQEPEEEKPRRGFHR